MATPDRFIATIALERPAEFSTDALVARLEQLFPILQARVTALGADHAKPGTNLLKIDETVLTVIPVDTPAPPDAFTTAIRTGTLWAEAEAELGRHKAIVIVSHLGAFTDYAGAVDRAICTTMVVTALLEMAPAIGLYWHAAETVIPAADAKAQGLALGKGDLPLAIWTKTRWFRGPLEPGASQPPVGLIMEGLAPFVGRDLELLPSHTDPRVIAQRAADCSTYLLRQGPVLKDGDTAGVTDGGSLIVKHAVSKFSARPVIQITELAKH